MAAPTRVQTISIFSAGSGSTIAVTLATTVTGNTYVVATGGNGTDRTIGMTTSAGVANFFPVIGTRVINGTVNRWADWRYAANVVGGTTPTITGTYNVATTERKMNAHEISGAHLEYPIDAKITATGTSTTPTASITTVDAETIVCGYCDNNNSTTITAGSGYTLHDHIGGTFWACEDQQFTSAGAKTVDFTLGGSGAWLLTAVSIKKAELKTAGAAWLKS